MQTKTPREQPIARTLEAGWVAMKFAIFRGWHIFAIREIFFRPIFEAPSMWKLRPLLAALLILLALGAVALYYAATRTTLGLMLSGDAVSSSTLVNNLDSEDSDLVMTSLELLKGRSDASGQQQARKLLNSSNDYIWFNAALYLGAINDRQAVPFLIKGLKHPASRAYGEVAGDLQALTSQKFGQDQAKWIAWWNQKNPTSTFSFAYASLERQSADIHTGSKILINRVIDPLHISFLGSPITLAGIRVKQGVNPATAQRLLETAMLGQFAEIERDGDQPLPDGSFGAVVWWIPDPINDPNKMSMLRQGLPAVPFSQRASLHGFLLQSGLYEPDWASIHDPGLRAEIQSLAPATNPAVP